MTVTLPVPFLNDSDEQSQFRDSVLRSLARLYDFDTRRGRLAAGDSAAPEVWAEFADLGWLAAPFSEADGGFGGGPRDFAIVMEGIGRALVLEPVLFNVALAGQVLARVGSSEQKALCLIPMTEGRSRLALGHVETQSRHRVTDCATRAEPSGTGWRLNGTKIAVFGAASADWLIVSARVSGGRRDAAGLGLFLLPATAPGVTLTPCTTVDGRGAAQVTLSDALAEPLGDPEGGAETLHWATDYAAVMTCAEAIGAMSAVLEQTLTHLKTREQFGAPLISNQALQFRVVDLWIEICECRALLDDALDLLGHGPSGALSQAVAAAKARSAQAARRVGQEAVQLHGALGTTDDVAASHYLKRLTVLEMSFGNADHHLQRLADALFARN